MSAKCHGSLHAVTHLKPCPVGVNGQQKVWLTCQFWQDDHASMTSADKPRHQPTADDVSDKNRRKMLQLSSPLCFFILMNEEKSFQWTEYTSQMARYHRELKRVSAMRVGESCEFRRIKMRTFNTYQPLQMLQAGRDMTRKGMKDFYTCPVTISMRCRSCLEQACSSIKHQQD